MGRKKLDKPAPKPPAPPKADAYSRFTEMGRERQLLLDTMLLKDEPMSVISRVLQEEWGLFKDVKNNTLQKQIQRYRDQVVLPRVKHLRAKEEAGVIGGDQRMTRNTKKMVERLNVLDEWEEILAIQKARILKVYAKEQELKDGKIMDSLTKLFKDYQMGLSQYTDLQLDTGYLKRAPKVLHGAIFGQDGERRAVFEFALEEKKEETDALADLSELLEKDVLEGECERIEPGA